MTNINNVANQSTIFELDDSFTSFQHAIKQVAESKRMLISAFEPHKNAIKQLTDQFIVMRTAFNSQNNPVKQAAVSFAKINSVIALNKDRFNQIACQIISMRTALVAQQDSVKSLLELIKPTIESHQIFVKQLSENNLMDDAINFFRIFSRKFRIFARKQILVYYLLDIVEKVNIIDSYMNNLDQSSFQLEAESKSTEFDAMCYRFVILWERIKKLSKYMKFLSTNKLKKIKIIRNNLVHGDLKFDNQILWDVYSRGKLTEIKQFALTELSKLSK